MMSIAQRVFLAVFCDIDDLLVKLLTRTFSLTLIFCGEAAWRGSLRGKSLAAFYFIHFTSYNLFICY